ncbi:hypothetical protein BGZ60DRAFT_564343 [Tricladium varicosporioides]|nr:hypothetical protein BGZ60DRAFT_564343 [Hymenoscyphus varicosporioides]
MDILTVIVFSVLVPTTEAGIEAFVGSEDIQAQLQANYKNLTALRTIPAPPWVEAPSFRGTTDILYSCIITLIACIYTALHLNIPAPKSNLVWQKVKWVFAALIAPEIVLYCASSQWIMARNLKKNLRRLRNTQLDADGHSKIPDDISMKYAFFVVMGGLLVRVDDIHDEREFVALTLNGVLQLAVDGHFPSIPQSKIDDRSKADFVQKVLVIIQVLWMATQCLARLLYKLPLSLIEIHTIVHVLCALVMFLFWIKKPLDVREAEILDTSNFRDLLGLMVQEQLYTEEADSIVIYNPTSSKDILSTGSRAPVTWVEFAENAHSTYVRGGEALRCGFGPTRRRDDFNYGLLVTRKGAVRWERAASAIHKIDYKDHDGDRFHRAAGTPRYEDSFYHNSLSTYSGNLPAHSESLSHLRGVFLFLLNELLLLFLLLLLPIAYGGIHLSAWNFDFPTPIEKFLWKIACFDIMGAVFVGFIFMLVLHATTHMGDEYGHMFWKTLASFISVLYGIVGLPFVAVYVISRIYIVVESFASLRAVPIGIYLMPSWVQMIPHV